DGFQVVAVGFSGDLAIGIGVVGLPVEGIVGGIANFGQEAPGVVDIARGKAAGIGGVGDPAQAVIGIGGLEGLAGDQSGTGRDAAHDWDGI
ncbi:hypothetical protein MNBD_GAMMA15-793, partial [hydrothermal vent metagenome]